MKRVIKVEKEMDIIDYLEEKTDYSRKKVKSLISHGQVFVNQQQVKLPYHVTVNDSIFVTNEKREATPFTILYEDSLFLVVDKKSGLLTVSNGGNEDTLYRQVYEYLHRKGEKVFIVHRLDKETSGIVLFAKKEEVKNILQDSWNEFVKERKYFAIVHGPIQPSGTIISHLQEKNTFVYSAKKGKKAITHYQVIKSHNNYASIDISIETGRKNQIRVHMKENGTPILGDKKYGIKDSFPRLALHAYFLSFYYPPHQKIYEFVSPIPKMIKAFPF